MLSLEALLSLLVLAFLVLASIASRQSAGSGMAQDYLLANDLAEVMHKSGHDLANPDAAARSQLDSLAAELKRCIAIRESAEAGAVVFQSSNCDGRANAILVPVVSITRPYYSKASKGFKEMELTISRV